MQHTHSIFRHSLVRELAIILAVKLVLLVGIWWLFFSLPKPRVNPATVSQVVVGENPQRAGVSQP